MTETQSPLFVECFHYPGQKILSQPRALGYRRVLSRAYTRLWFDMRGCLNFSGQGSTLYILQLFSLHGTPFVIACRKRHRVIADDLSTLRSKRHVSDVSLGKLLKSEDEEAALGRARQSVIPCCFKSFPRVVPIHHSVIAVFYIWW